MTAVTSPITGGITFESAKPITGLPGPADPGDQLLLESGDFLLLEDGSTILLE